MRGTATHSRCSVCSIVEGGAVVRAFVPGAGHLEVLREGQASFGLERRGGDFFEGFLPGETSRFSYRLHASNLGGTWEFADPYGFGPVWGRSTIISSWKERTASSTAGSAPISLPMKASTACCSRFGRRKRSAFRWWEISTAGTDGCIRCASASTAAYGRFSRPALAKAPITNTRSLAPTGSCSR